MIYLNVSQILICYIYKHIYQKIILHMYRDSEHLIGVSHYSKHFAVFLLNNSGKQVLLS